MVTFTNRFATAAFWEKKRPLNFACMRPIDSDRSIFSLCVCEWHLYCFCCEIVVEFGIFKKYLYIWPISFSLSCNCCQKIRSAIWSFPQLLYHTENLMACSQGILEQFITRWVHFYSSSMTFYCHSYVATTSLHNLYYLVGSQKKNSFRSQCYKIFKNWLCPSFKKG